MAVGDEASAAGFSLVPDSGEEGRVKWGAREINRTRDYTARVKAGLPTSKDGFRAAGGVSSGTDDPLPEYGTDGDVYFKII